MTRKNPLKLVKGAIQAFLVAFGTSSRYYTNSYTNNTYTVEPLESGHSEIRTPLKSVHFS